LETLKYITVKTQVRRLKYLSIALKLLSHTGLQKQILSELLLKWSKDNHNSFKDYSSPTGEITLSNGKVFSNSLTAYYHALRELSMILEQGNFVLPTKSGEILIILLEQINEYLNHPIENTYTLNNIEKSFFICILLEFDYDIIILILQMVKLFPKHKLEFYLGLFQNMYIERLTKKLGYSKVVDASNILETRKRINSWRSPKRYSEELVPPRLNWLIDLKLLNHFPEDGHYELNRNGLAFLEFININSQLEREYSIYDPDFHQKNLISLISNIYFENKIFKNWIEVNEEQKSEYAMEGLAIASRYFCVLGIPRMPAKSTLLLCCLFLLNKYFINVNTYDLSNWIGFKRNLNGRVYGYRKAPREGESYIVISHE